MTQTTSKLLSMFVHQNKIFVFGPRELAAAKELAMTDLFKLTTGECAGVSGHWLTMSRQIS